MTLRGNPATPAAIVLAVILTITSQRYDYHRDELYFRMLPVQWGYVDQPPLLPLLARLTRFIADEPWAQRIPATIAVTAAVFVAVAIVRELDGSLTAQRIAAWSLAGSSAAFIFGHVFLTATFDLLTWPLITLFVIRAIKRDEGRWWIWGGLVAGLSSYYKLLVVWLLVGLAVGLVVAGPRRITRAMLLGCGLAALIAAPNIVYQLTHGLPQLEMGAALAANNASETRVFMWVILIVVLGPPLVPIWIAGLITTFQRAELRCVGIAFVVVVGLTFAAGTQPYYPTGLLVVLLAVGSIPAAKYAKTVVAAAGVNSVVSALVGLPLLSPHVLGSTFIPDMNLAAADQIGWQRYVEQIDQIATEHGIDTVVTSNYGEAGALDRYAPHLSIFSAQNALYDRGHPHEDPIVFVGMQLPAAARYFAECAVVATLDNQVGVGNEEQGAPVAICRHLNGTWESLWPKLKHLD